MYAAHFVGTEMGEVKPINQRHSLRLLPPLFSDRRFVAVKVWLFSDLGMPTHYVVVGTPR